MYQIARPERDIFAQLFLELSDIISSHHYDALIHKSFISWWLRFLKFHILARFLFFSLIDGRAGPPRILTRAPPPSSPFCLVSQIYFGRFFREPRWSHPTRRVGPKSKGVPCFRSKWGGLHHILHILYILHILHNLHILQILYILYILHILHILYILHILHILLILHILYILHILHILHILSTPSQNNCKIKFSYRNG